MLGHGADLRNGCQISSSLHLSNLLVDVQKVRLGAVSATCIQQPGIFLTDGLADLSERAVTDVVVACLIQARCGTRCTAPKAVPIAAFNASRTPSGKFSAAMLSPMLGSADALRAAPPRHPILRSTRQFQCGMHCGTRRLHPTFWLRLHCLLCELR